MLCAPFPVAADLCVGSNAQLGLSSASAHASLAVKDRWSWSQKFTSSMSLSPRHYPPSLLDHVLLSDALYQRIHAVKIVHDNTRASDHDPLVVEFVF